LKRLAIIGLAVTALLALAAVAVAQYALPVVEATANVTPAKGGTKKKPKNATVEVGAKVNAESHSTTDQITILVSRDITLSGKGFAFCPTTKINKTGKGSCPAKSKIGTGAAEAFGGTAKIPYTIDIFAASPNEIALALTGPVSAPALSGVISKAGAPYGQKVTIDIPSQLTQPAPGFYSEIRSLTAKLKGQGSTGKGKKKKKTNFASLTGCTGGAHQFGIRMRFIPNPTPPQKTFAEDTTTVPCKKK
jgi:hypothetical protein